MRYVDKTSGMQPPRLLVRPVPVTEHDAYKVRRRTQVLLASVFLGLNVLVLLAVLPAFLNGMEDRTEFLSAVEPPHR